MTEAAAAFYPIGTPGTPWTEKEDQEWKAQTKCQRSYDEQVVQKIKAMDQQEWEIVQYGSLSHNPEKYPLYCLKSKEWNSDRPSMLVTGGVHGYETSGVQGALLFCQTKAQEYAGKCNLLVVPCVSPWAYEHIQRWNNDLMDPNRSFVRDDSSKQTEESKALMHYIQSTFGLNSFSMHVDCHETTDTDETEFMPAKHAKAGLPYNGETIPDGFYLVGDSVKQERAFHKAMIDAVARVTHIAPPDGNGNIIDEPVVQEGLIEVPIEKLGLCASLTNAKYSSTTEVYPDSPKATDEICNQAQVACVSAGIDYVLSNP